MPPDSPPPTPPAGKPKRPPVPGWMWLLVTLGPVLGGTPLGLVAGLGDGGHVGQALSGVVAGMMSGGFFIPVLAGGLALSGRFFTGNAARLAGTLLFSALILLGLGAVFFAGCMCLVGDNPKFYR